MKSKQPRFWFSTLLPKTTGKLSNQRQSQFSTRDFFPKLVFRNIENLTSRGRTNGINLYRFQLYDEFHK